MALEIAVETYFVKRVEKDLGGMALKGDVPGRRFLDRIAILPGGRTCYVELKRPKSKGRSAGRLTGHQTETIKRLRDLGHDVATLYTKEQVDEWIRKRSECSTVGSTVSASPGACNCI